MSNTPQLILQLVETFDRNIDNFKKQNYNEAQVRQQFINPFFEALGWDMQNKAGIALAYSDVIHEDAIKVGGSTKAPDYCFRVGGTKKFFVEAKKPSVDIKSDVSPAYQLRRYAWSAKLPLSILTDFEEFAVYDCQVRPNVSDKPSTARIFFCTYKEYADKWEQIANIFGKDAVLKGLFDTYASEKTTKRGTTTVDKEFLAEIEGWRNELAKNIAIRNGRLSVYDLNFAVQKTIDRILFLRICEDRGIERSDQLLGLINGSRVYPRLFELFEKSDERYNSGIFHFHKEKDRPESPDELSANLKVDDDVLKKIIKDLYYPCPYEFSIMPAEILGNVYEQFLGKVIRLTASHQAKVEEKPEVKKAGGVYYTPSYIVDYIVKNTVGKLCEGKTPRQIEKLKILDPACGSGSFLIGAYQYLLDFHRDYYAKEPAKHKKAIYQGKGKQWFLTIEEKKRILLNNIYGVDIDSQAVEVTKLSLLLKVLENETQESLRLFHERALPDLGNNIKCGNSLIGPDFYQNQQLTLFDDEQQRKINAFDWQKEFAEIFAGKTGGFDCVIGNPPWISLTGKFGTDTSSKSEINYLIRKYSGNTYMPNMYEYFVAHGLNIVAYKGLFSFIVPDRLGFNAQFVSLRQRMLTESQIYSIVNRVPFPGITADTMIFVLEKTNNPVKHRQVRIGEYGLEQMMTPQSYFEQSEDFSFKYYDNSEAMHLIEKIEKNNKISRLFEICESTSGFGGKSKEITSSKISKNQVEIIKGSSILRYVTRESLWFDFKKENITGRTTDRNKLGAVPKLLLRKTGDSFIATYDTTGIYPEQSLYFLYDNHTNISFKYLLGLINSNLFSFYYRNRLITNRRSIAQIKKMHLDTLPIRTIDFSNKTDKSLHDKMVSLVEQMLELNKKLSGIKNPDEKTRLQRQIDATDTQIDKLVYDLYGLTPEEIKIVEGSYVK